jgi:hypothetical protein
MQETFEAKVPETLPHSNCCNSLCRAFLLLLQAALDPKQAQHSPELSAVTTG